MEKETRRILTRLHGPIQKDILASVLGQLSDGRWQNSPRMNPYWQNADVEMDGDDVVLVIKKHAFPYYAMSDAQILKWFGKKIKQLIKEELEHQERTVTWLARKLNCTRATVYRIFEKNSLDTALLSTISKVLNRDFFKELSEDIKT